MSIENNSAPGGLRARRLARKLSQQRLAERARCSLSMIRLLESGYHPADSAVLPRVERALKDEGPADTEPLATSVPANGAPEHVPSG